jgi:hypothetical protein
MLATLIAVPAVVSLSVGAGVNELSPNVLMFGLIHNFDIWFAIS